MDEIDDVLDEALLKSQQKTVNQSYEQVLALVFASAMRRAEELKAHREREIKIDGIVDGIKFSCVCFSALIILALLLRWIF